MSELRELDARRRISLKGIGLPEHRYYKAHTEDDGTIVLTPAVIIPITEVNAYLHQAQETQDDG